MSEERPEMLHERRDGCRCSEETHVKLRREPEETKRELRSPKSRKEKPLSPSDEETLGAEKTVGPLTSTDAPEMFKVGPQTELLHASHGGVYRWCDAKILSFIEQAVTLRPELDVLLKERRIILSRLQELETPPQSSEAAVSDKVVKRKTAISNQNCPMRETGRIKAKYQGDELQKELGSKKVQRPRRQEETRIPERDETPSFWKKVCRVFGRNRSKTRKDLSHVNH